MRELYELGIVFRGFIIVNHSFRELPGAKGGEKKGTALDPRGAFISAITTFAESAFSNNAIEYLEIGPYLFIFKFGKIKSLDSNIKEPFIIYGIVDKRKKPDKFVKKFLESIVPILKIFVETYNNKDLTELDQFRHFKYDVIGHFL